MLQATLVIFCCVLSRCVDCSGGFEKPFGCQGMSLNDQSRQGVLNLMNRVRSSVALGDFQALNYLSSASDMNKLRWDCSLETMAQRVVQYCSQIPTASVVTNGVNYQYFGSGTPSYVLISPIESAVLDWIDIVDMTWPDNNIFNGNEGLHDFSNLIRATTTAVGCASTRCGDVASAAACVFSQPDVQVGTLVYTSGMPCRNDGDCGRFSPGFCESGLCVNGTRRPAMECPSTAFNAVFRETALGIHNNFRSLVARGLARNGEYANENAPPTSRMNLLRYDCNAEQLALNHVRLCDRRPSPPAARPGYQENIHILETTATDALGAIQNAVATWSRELTTNGIPSNMIFTPEVSLRHPRSVTNVAKILWGSNRNVGCATQVCNGFYFTSCMYQAPVNVVGQNIYNIGAVCSACPPGPSNCSLATGLCPS